MKEIGGYFGLDQLIDKPYHKDMIEINTGRNALIYLVEAKKIKKIYLPYFLCDSVTNMLDGHAVEYDYYHINKDFMPNFNQELNAGDYLYVVNYYGQITDDKIITLKEKYSSIILDNTQAFFQKPILEIDTIYSCRKFFGVPDGAYLSTDVKFKIDLEIDASRDRMTHILGRYEGNASDYYMHFQNNDKYLNKESLKYMSKLTHNILGALDYQLIREIRNENFIYLHTNLRKYNKIKLSVPEAAFTYPLHMDNGYEVKKELAKNKIYIPTLWPNVLNSVMQDSLEYDYAANILPIPCDQRYGIEDMQYIISVLIKYLK